MFMNFIILLAALLWDRILGEPPVKIHPTVWMGNYIKNFWRLKTKKNPALDFIWGSLLLISGILLFTLPLYFFLSFLSEQVYYFYLILSIPLLKCSFSIRYLLQTADEVRQALQNSELEEARKLTAYHLVSRETSGLSEGQVVSAVIESVAENITDSFISPLFYFFLAGVPGAWGFRLINTSDAMIAYRIEEFEWGGKLTAWTDSFLNWIPARITAMGIVLSAGLIPGVNGRNSFKCMKYYHRETASPNAGWTMSAMAGALEIKLEKIGEYNLDGGRKELTSGKIESCLKVTRLALFITMAVVIVLFTGGLWALNTVV